MSLVKVISYLSDSQRVTFTTIELCAKKSFYSKILIELWVPRSYFAVSYSLNCMPRSHFFYNWMNCVPRTDSKLLIKLCDIKFFTVSCLKVALLFVCLLITNHESFYYTRVTNSRFNIQLVLTATLIFMSIVKFKECTHPKQIKKPLEFRSQHSTKITMKLAMKYNYYNKCMQP